MGSDFETRYEMYQKDLQNINKKRDYSKLKLLPANEIINKIVKGDKDFSNVKIFGIDWARRDLSGFNFSGSKIEWCIFSGCKIKNADFSGAFLDSCLFESANLSKSNFKNSTVRGSGFLDADLTDVDFSNSDLGYTAFINIIGRPKFTNCIQTKIWHSIEEALKEYDQNLETIRRYIEVAGLSVPQSLTLKVKFNELASSTEKLKFFYNVGRETFNPEGNLNQ